MVCGAFALNVRHVDPDQRDAQQRIELFDLVVEHRLIVGGDEAQIRAAVVDAVETEIAGVQPHQYRRAPGVAADRAALRAGIESDRFAVGPIGLPPGGGLRRAAQARAQCDERQQ